MSIGPDIASQLGLPAVPGVLVERTVPGGPADRAGILGGKQQAYLGNTPIFIGGDLIVAIDGDQVTNDQDIAEIMDGHQAGQTGDSHDLSRSETDGCQSGPRQCRGFR